MRNTDDILLIGALIVLFLLIFIARFVWSQYQIDKLEDEQVSFECETDKFDVQIKRIQTEIQLNWEKVSKAIERSQLVARRKRSMNLPARRSSRIKKQTI